MSTYPGPTFPRRDVLRHGLLGLAMLAVRPLAGCAGNDGVGSPDAGGSRSRRAGGTAVRGKGGSGSIGAGDGAGSSASAGAGGSSRDAGGEATSPGSGGTPNAGGAASPGGRTGAGGANGGGASSGGDEAGAGGAPEAGPGILVSNLANVGRLGAPDGNRVRLPPGFTSRIVARTGEAPLPGGSYIWHIDPDGGATFATPDGGFIYVSNSEETPGGAGALRFDAAGELVDAYSILRGTDTNCAGGATPWGTWLSCEETARGTVYECDPAGVVVARQRLSLGVFRHEAAVVDPVKRHVYLTEDEPDGGFYRFTPRSVGLDGVFDLARGTLEVAKVDGSSLVTWHPVPDPRFTGATPTRHQVPGSTAFNGGEGVTYFDHFIYFSTKGDDRVWAYDTDTGVLGILYERATAANPILSGVDNLTVTASGDVLVAEDWGDMEVVAILPDGSLKPLLQILDQDTSEITGLAFDPSGTRLYLSSQRGTGSGGITYEITGPFHVRA